MSFPGSTVAVLATGLDRLYPTGHERLFEHIEQSGEWIALPILQIAYSAIRLAELGCVLALLGLFDREHTRAVITRQAAGPRELSAQRR